MSSIYALIDPKARNLFVVIFGKNENEKKEGRMQLRSKRRNEKKILKNKELGKAKAKRRKLTKFSVFARAQETKLN